MARAPGPRLARALGSIRPATARREVSATVPATPPIARHQGVSSGRQHPRQPGPPQGRPEVPHDRRRVRRRPRRRAALAGAAHVTYVRSTVAHGTITVDRHRRGRGDARRARRLHRRRPRPRAGAVAVQPDGRPHAARQRQGALRRRADRRRRHRDARAGRRRRRGGDRRLRRRSTALVDLEEALAADDAALRGRRQQRRVRLDGARHARTSPATSSSPTARSSSRGRFLNQRVAPCPLEVARRRRWRGSTAGSHQWLSTQHAQGVKDAIAGRQRPRRRPGAGHHARRRRRLRRQDRRLPRGDRCSAGSPSELGRPVRWQRDPQRVDDGARPRPGPGPAHHDRRHPRRQGPRTTGSQRAPGRRRVRRDGHDPRPVHDPADGVGRLRHPEHRVPHDVGRHQHDADRRLPRRRPAGGHRRHRAGDGPVRRRDRHGPGRGAPDEPDRRSSPSRTRPSIGQTYDVGDYERRPRQGARRGRLRRAARRAGARAATPATPCSSASASASTSRSPAACRRSARAPRSRCATTAGPSSTPARRRTARATTRRGR